MIQNVQIRKKKCTTTSNVDVASLLRWLFPDDWPNGNGLHGFMVISRALHAASAIRNTVVTLLVAQAEVAMKESVSIYVAEREQQGGESSPVGASALSHQHLAAVDGTLVLDEKLFHVVVRVGCVGSVAVLQYNHKVWVSHLHGNAHVHW